MFFIKDKKINFTGKLLIISNTRYDVQINNKSLEKGLSCYIQKLIVLILNSN